MRNRLIMVSPKVSFDRRSTFCGRSCSEVQATMPVTARQCGGRNRILRRPGCCCDDPPVALAFKLWNDCHGERGLAGSRLLLLSSSNDWLRPKPEGLAGRATFFGDACMLKFISLAVLTVFFFVTADVARAHKVARPRRRHPRGSSAPWPMEPSTGTTTDMENASGSTRTSGRCRLSIAWPRPDAAEPPTDFKEVNGRSGGIRTRDP